jgi:predicted Na+-dependent transporter
LLLRQLGEQARWVLPFGLFLGAVLPGPAAVLAHWIPFFIALILLIACLQIRQAVDLRTTLNPRIFLWLLVFQLVLPVAVWCVLTVIGLSAYWVVPAVLVAMAAPITGGPSLVIILKGDAREALNFLLTGTMLLPLTCVPALLLINSTGSIVAVIMTAAKLLLLIAVVLLIAGLIRKNWIGLSRYRDNKSLDGLSALCLAIVVIGLMAAFHGEGVQGVDIAYTLGWAIVINACYQLFGYHFGKRFGGSPIASGVSSGNRNVALFLVALPSEVSAPLLLFIACYQIPMYLTPLVGSYFYPKSQEQS